MIKIGIRKQDNDKGFIGLEGEVYGAGVFTPIKEVIVEGVTSDNVQVNGVDVSKVYVDGVLVFDIQDPTAPPVIEFIGVFAPPVAYVGVNYLFDTAGLFTGPVVSYELTKTLPSGLTFDTVTGAISGNPNVESVVTGLAVIAHGADSEAVYSNVNDLTVLTPAVGDFSALQDIVNGMSPGDWVEIPNTIPPIMTLDELEAIQTEFGGDRINGTGGPGSVIDSGVSATSDGVRWWFHGGGAANYGGNEFLEFNLHSLSWRRLTLPSPLNGEVINAPDLPEGHAPSTGFGAMKTGSAIAWSPVTRTIWLAKSSTVFASRGKGNYDPIAFWEFNPDTLAFTRHNLGEDIGSGYLIWDETVDKFLAFPRRYDTPGPYYFDENMVISDRNSVVEGPATVVPAYNPNTRKVVEIATPALYQEKLYETDISAQPITKKTLLHTFSQSFRDELRKDSCALYDNNTDEYLWMGVHQFLDTKRLVGLNATTGEERIYYNASSTVAPHQTNPAPYLNKLLYVPEVDAYMFCNSSEGNVYVHKRDINTYTVPDANEIRAIITETDGTTTRSYTSIYEAGQDLNDGETITVQPGDWYEGLKINASNITVNGAGAALGRAVAAKACIALYGTGPYVVNDIELKYSVVNGIANAAGWRNEPSATPITLNNIYSHDNCNGALTSNDYGDYIIDNSHYTNNGYRAGSWGQEHNIYIGLANTVQVYNSLFNIVWRAGHIFKCRALETVIDNCKFYHDDDGWSSRVMDFPMGGKIDISNSVIGFNPLYSEQLTVISFCVELPRYPQESYPKTPSNDWHYFNLDNCLIMSDQFGEDREVYWPYMFNLASEKWPDDYSDVAAPVLTNCTIIGNWRPNPTMTIDNSNTFYATREEAGLPPYPSMDFDWPPVP